MKYVIVALGFIAGFGIGMFTSSEFGINIEGDSATVVHCTFSAINMDWIDSLRAVDPTEENYRPLSDRESSSSSKTGGTDANMSPVTLLDDLLDAIEWVESKGDANAVGDWETYIYGNCGIETPCLRDWRVDKAVKENDILYCKHAQAVGAYQLHKIYVDECNRIFLLNGQNPDLEYEHRWSKSLSRGMVKMYMMHWGAYKKPASLRPRDVMFEDLARIHNGGPDGWQNDPNWFVRNRDYTLKEAKEKIANTKAYWQKIKARLEQK